MMKQGYSIWICLMTILGFTIIYDSGSKVLGMVFIMGAILAEIIAIKSLNDQKFSFANWMNWLIVGLEGIIGFGMIIKLLSGGRDFFGTPIECATFVLIGVFCLILLPRMVIRKTKLNSKWIAVLLLYLVLDHYIKGITLSAPFLQFYQSGMIEFADSPVSALLYMVWILDVEFVKKYVS